MRLEVGEERDGDGGLDVVLEQAFLGETSSWFLRKKPRQTRRQWGPEVAGPGASDCQTVDVVASGDSACNRGQEGGVHAADNGARRNRKLCAEAL